MGAKIQQCHHRNNYILKIGDPLCETQAKVSKSNYEENKHQSLISTIHFTIISIFDMTLLGQY